MESDTGTLEFVLSLVTMGLSGALWLAVLIGGLVKWSQVRTIFKAGLVLGCVILLFKLPGTLATAYFLDVDNLMGQMGFADGPEVMQVAFQFAMLFGVVLGLVGLVAGALHVALAVGLGQVAQPNAYPLLAGAQARFGGWGIACVLGAIGSTISMVVFIALDVSEGAGLMWLLETLMPGYTDLPSWIQYGLGLPTVVAAAIAEEVTYRGILQGWLTKLLGGGRAAVIVAVVVASSAWAIAHVGNTDAVGIKLSQIFLLGLVFGWLARRYSVEAAIVAHVSLNVVLVVGAFVSL